MARGNTTPTKTAFKKGDPSRPVGKPWPKGVCPNPKGRPKDGHSNLQKLQAAIEKAEAAGNWSLWEHVVKTIKKDNKVLIAVLKKLVPDLASVNMDAEISGKDGAAILVELLQRARGRTKDADER